jgi:cytochrome P450
VVERLRPAIMTAVDDFLDAVAAKVAAGQPVDAVSDYALPLPFTVICRLLGFPAADIGKLTSWSDALLRSIDPMLAIMGNRPDASRAAQGIVELHRYVEAVVAGRVAEPGPDLITSLLAAEDAGVSADRDLVVRFCVVLLVSGYETLVNLITNGILALIRHPSQLAALRADPGRGGLVVEEVLRYDPPVQLIVRTAKDALPVGNVVLEPSSTVVSVIAGAQREPGRYQRPDEFDPDRPDQQHLAFGLGHHFCLGAVLARLEGGLALARFAQRVTGPDLDGRPLAYRRGITIRGLQELIIGADEVAPRTVPWPDAGAADQGG